MPASNQAPLSSRKRSSSSLHPSSSSKSHHPPTKHRKTSSHASFLTLPPDLLHLITLYLPLPCIFLSLSLLSQYHHTTLFGVHSHYLWKRLAEERFHMRGLREGRQHRGMMPAPLSLQVIERLKSWISTHGFKSCSETNRDLKWLRASHAITWRMKQKYLISDMITCDWSPGQRILLVDFWSIVRFDLNRGIEEVLFTQKSSRLFHKPQKLLCCARVYEGNKERRTLLCLMSRRDHTPHGRQVIVGLPLIDAKETGTPSRRASIQHSAAVAARLSTSQHAHTSTTPITSSAKSTSPSTFTISCRDMCAYHIMDENTILIASHSALFLYDAIQGDLITECKFAINSKAGEFAQDQSLSIVREDTLICVASARKMIVLQFVRARTGTPDTFKVVCSFSKLSLNTSCPMYIFNREFYASQVQDDTVSFLKIDLSKRTSVTALKKSRLEYCVMDIKVAPISNAILILWGDLKGTRVQVDCVRENSLLWSKSIALPWDSSTGNRGIGGVAIGGSKLNNLQIISNVVSVCLRSSLHHTTAHTYLLSIETGHELQLRHAETGGKRYETGMPNWWSLHREKFVEFE